MKKPRISVLLPVYNGDQYLRESIESILNQTFHDFEFLIISEHGTSDESLAIIESYSDERIRHIHNATRLGLVGSLNLGLKEARGEYIARMDADDFSMPERLAMQIMFMDKNPEVGVLGSGFEMIDNNGNLISTIRFPSQHSFIKWSLFFHSPIAHPTVMMRKSIVNKVGGYSLEAIYCEDYDLWIRLSKLTLLSNLQDILLILRKHETNVTQSCLEEHLNNTTKINQKLINSLLGENITLEFTRNMWDQKFNSTDDAIRAAKLIYRLYQTSFVFNTDDNQLLRKDAVKRLFNLIRPRILDIRIWSVFVFVFHIDPFFIFRLVLRPIISSNPQFTQQK